MSPRHHAPTYHTGHRATLCGKGSKRTLYARTIAEMSCLHCCRILNRMLDADREHVRARTRARIIGPGRTLVSGAALHTTDFRRIARHA